MYVYYDDRVGLCATCTFPVSQLSISEGYELKSSCLQRHSQHASSLCTRQGDAFRHTKVDEPPIRAKLVNDCLVVAGCRLLHGILSRREGLLWDGGLRIYRHSKHASVEKQRRHAMRRKLAGGTKSSGQHSCVG